MSQIVALYFLWAFLPTPSLKMLAFPTITSRSSSGSTWFPQTYYASPQKPVNVYTAKPLSPTHNLLKAPGGCVKLFAGDIHLNIMQFRHYIPLCSSSQLMTHTQLAVQTKNLIVILRSSSLLRDMQSVTQYCRSYNLWFISIFSGRVLTVTFPGYCNSM